MRSARLLWGIALLLAACSRGGAPGGAAAPDVDALQARYLSLVEKKLPLGAPEYVALLQDLERVPDGAPGAPRARSLAQRLRAATAPLPPRPLARPDLDGGHAHCVAEVEALGRAGPRDREKLWADVVACRKAILDDCGDHDPVSVAK